MYERILVPLDGSAAGESVLVPVQWLARRASSEVLLAQVDEPHPQDVGPGFKEETKEFSVEYLRQVTEALKKSGLRADYRVRAGAVVDELVALAREERVSLIAMTTHGRTASPQVPYGGVAERLMRASPVPLLALPTLRYPAEAEQRARGVRVMLLATDGSAAARAVRPHAGDLARFAGAEVLLLHVGAAEPGWLAEEARELSARVLVEPGEPAATILKVAAREKVDLIAMGTHGSGGRADTPAGSVTREVLRNSPIPLLIARER